MKRRMEGTPKQGSISEFPNSINKNPSELIGKLLLNNILGMLFIKVVLEPYIVSYAQTISKHLNPSVN